MRPRSPIDALTKVHQLTYAIERAITDGNYAPGERLPAVEQLADAHGVSENTVADVLRHLKDVGLLEGDPADGVYIAHPLPVVPVSPKQVPRCRCGAEAFCASTFPGTTAYWPECRACYPQIEENQRTAVALRDVPENARWENFYVNRRPIRDSDWQT